MKTKAQDDTCPDTRQRETHQQRRTKISTKKEKEEAQRVPEVWFVCTDCGDTLAWNNFNDGTPVCMKCGTNMVVDMSKYRGGY